CESIAGEVVEICGGVLQALARELRGVVEIEFAPRESARDLAVAERRRAAGGRGDDSSGERTQLVGWKRRVLAHLEEQPGHRLVARRRIGHPWLFNEGPDRVEETLPDHRAVWSGARPSGVSRNIQRFAPLIRATEHDVLGLRRTRSLRENEILEHDRLRFAT